VGTAAMKRKDRPVRLLRIVRGRQRAARICAATPPTMMALFKTNCPTGSATFSAARAADRGGATILLTHVTGVSAAPSVGHRVRRFHRFLPSIGRRRPRSRRRTSRLHLHPPLPVGLPAPPPEVPDGERHPSLPSPRCCCPQSKLCLDCPNPTAVAGRPCRRRCILDERCQTHAKIVRSKRLRWLLPFGGIESSVETDSDAGSQFLPETRTARSDQSGVGAEVAHEKPAVANMNGAMDRRRPSCHRTRSRWSASQQDRSGVLSPVDGRRSSASHDLESYPGPIFVSPR